MRYELGEALVLELCGKKAEELAERDAASVTDEHWTSQFKTVQEACACNGALAGAQWFAAVKKQNEELLDDETKRWRRRLEDLQEFRLTRSSQKVNLRPPSSKKEEPSKPKSVRPQPCSLRWNKLQDILTATAGGHEVVKYLEEKVFPQKLRYKGLYGDRLTEPLSWCEKMESLLEVAEERRKSVLWKLKKSSENHSYIIHENDMIEM